MTEAWKMLIVLVTCLVTYSSASDIEDTHQEDTEVLQADERILSYGNPEGIGIFFVQICTMTVLTLSAIYVIYVIFLPPVRQRRSVSSTMWDLLPETDSYDVFSFLNQALKSAEALESTLDAMEVNSRACGNLTLCEMQRAASRTPALNALLQFFRPSIGLLQEDREGQGDCVTRYVECPNSLFRAVFGDQLRQGQVLLVDTQHHPSPPYLL
nr:uncharacterized protein LOC123768860 [Procambarus clarkii]